MSLTLVVASEDMLKGIEASKEALKATMLTSIPVLVRPFLALAGINWMLTDLNTGEIKAISHTEEYKKDMAEALRGGPEIA